MSILRPSQLSSGSYSISGSFSGSFEGDGSNITGLTSEWDGSHLGDASITGSLILSGSSIDLNVLGNISASAISSSTYYGDGSNLTGITATTSSYALTASYVETSQTSSYVETAQTASYVLNAISSSFSTFAISASYAVSASHEIIKEISSSYADTASFAQSGDGIFSGSFSGSYVGDGSGLTGILHTSASYASTASYVETAQTASYVLNAISSSYSQTSSYIEISQTASYVETAQTASYVLNAVSSSFSSTSSYSITSSFAQSGDGIFSGSFSGSYVGDGSGLTGILHTTSSYALTASYVETSQTASYVLNSQTSSYVETSQTASYVTTSSIDGITNYVRNDQTSSMTVLSSSYAISSSYSETTDFILGGNVFGPVVDAVNAISSSYATTSSYIENAQTASYVLNAVSSSYALTASYAVSASHEIIKEISSSYADTASFAQSGNGIFSGSFSGSYVGDGSGLTNIPTPNAVVTASNATNDDTIEFLKGGGGTFSITVNNIETSQTASYVLNAISSSYATTSSYVETAQTASYVLNAISSSYATTSSYVETSQTASYVLNAVSSSYALTSSYVNPLTQDVIITGSLTVSGSNSIVNLQELQFDIEHIPTGHSTGRMYWDDTNKTATLDMQGSDVRLQIGQEAHVYAKNISGVTIANGAAVRISGATGANLNIELALSTVKSFKSTIEKNEILGLATEEILNNQSGYITTFGSVGDLDTSAFAEGDILYLSHLVSGSYSNIRPPAPCFEARVGVVKVSNNGAGVIISRPAEPIFLTDISQVTSSGVIPNEKAYLVYDDSTDLINFTNELSGSFSGSFQGDGSGLTGILHTSASYALTASYVETSQTASYVLNSQTASYVETAQTASYVLNAVSSSYATTASYVETAQTASYVLNAISSSYATTALSASYAPSSPSISSSYATTASFAQSGDGIFSGSFSGSFEGDGFGLTDVPVTVTNTLWVSPAGDNSTAIKGNLQRPWATVREAVGSAAPGDSVIMVPGTYIESPFVVSSGVTLKSLGGLKSTTISASNNSATFITQEENSRLEGFTLVCPSGSFPGISYDNVGTGTIYDVTLKGQGNSIGFQIDETSTTSKVIYNEIRYGGGDFDKLLYIKGGIFACDGVHIPGGGNIDKIYHMEAGRLQAINTNAGNPNVSSSFYMEGGTSIILGTNLFNVQEAFHIAGQPYNIQGMNVYVDDNVPKHLTVDTGISGSDSNVVFVAAHMEAARISAPPEFVNSEHSFTFQDDGVKLKPSFRVYSDIEVGHANKGFTLGAGEGLPYNKGMEIWASGSGGVSQSLTVAATSKDSSTFNFAYSASGDYMYFGNKQKSPNIADQFLYFTGLQYKQVSTGSYSPGDITLEIFTTASTWESIDGAQAVSSEEGYNYANNIFSHNDSEEEIIANVNTNVWATSSNFGINARWGRIRLINPITTSPVFEQFIYTPNTTLINPKGQLSFRGKALSRQTISIIGNTWGTPTGGTGLSDYTANNIGNDANWNHVFTAINIDANNVYAYNQLTIPAGTCTAYPLKVTISYINPGVATSTPTLDVALIKGSNILINDPDGSKVPTARTLANSNVYDSADIPITSFTGDALAQNLNLQTVTFSPVDISSYYEGDTILLKAGKSAGGNNDLIIASFEVSFVKWTLGERTK